MGSMGMCIPQTGYVNKQKLLLGSYAIFLRGEEQNREREKWPKKRWEDGEIGGKSREEGEKET